MGARAKLAAEMVALVGALVFAFVLAFVPHLDTTGDPIGGGDPSLVRLAKVELQFLAGNRTGYPYPIHVDEHLHWARIAGLQRQERVVIDDPYSGLPADRNVLSQLRGAIHERGFQIVVAEIQWLTGIPFLELYAFLPAAWMAFGGFALYAALRPGPGAVLAAAFSGLVPTSLRFMGPAFLVPIGFVLPWLPATLILAEPAKRHVAAALVLFVTTLWAFFIHLIGGFACVGLLAVGAAVAAPKERRASLVLFLVALLPVLWLYRAFTGDVQAELKKEDTLPIDFTIFDGFGLVALYLWAAGLVLLAVRRPRSLPAPLLALAAGSGIMLGMILWTVAAETTMYATYARWHPPFFFTAAAALGYGVATIAEGAGRGIQRLLEGMRPAPRAGSTASLLVSLGLFMGTVSAPIDDHMAEPYYRIMNPEVWESYEFISKNVGPEYEVFLSHPWRAPLLNAMSGKYPHAVLFPGQAPVNGEHYDNYVRTGASLEFFILNDITLVATKGRPPYPEFTELGPGAWGLRPEIAEEIAEIRMAERR